MNNPRIRVADGLTQVLNDRRLESGNFMEITLQFNMQVNTILSGPSLLAKVLQFTAAAYFSSSGVLEGRKRVIPGSVARQVLDGREQL
jgi:hypothetical protein